MYSQGIGAGLELGRSIASVESELFPAQMSKQKKTENNTTYGKDLLKIQWEFLFIDWLRGKGARVYPLKPQVISNLNSLLQDIYVRNIALKDKEFKKYYNVFETVFFELHHRMKEVDRYYKHYSTTVQFAGSHYDRLRINKPDEFDMDICIDLPVDARENRRNPAKSAVVIEDLFPGFVQLKMGTEFQNLPNKGVDWEINQTAYKWLDSQNYLLRSLFMNWFHSVVDKAMNTFDEDSNGCRYMPVAGIPYTLRLSASGPAITLITEDTSRGFRLDVDLVPAIKFPEDRYPKTKKYRKVPKRCKKEDFMVVPKPMKGRKRIDTDRSWRLNMQRQERDLMYDTMHMRQTIRLIKKLRDSLEMEKIASYFIKTMFCHEAIKQENDPDFWSRNSPAELFIIMVKKFHKYLKDKNIPYFWNEDENLIGDIDEATLVGYAHKLAKLIQVLDNPSQYKLVAEFLLTKSQFKEYNKKYLHIKAGLRSVGTYAG